MRIRFIPSLLVLTAVPAYSQSETMLGDLDSRGRTTLSRDELVLLMPNARMSKTTDKGNTHLWTNEPGGNFIVSSDNRAARAGVSTAPGKWHVSDEGKYCVVIEWKHTPAEDWCRYIIQSDGKYFAARSDKNLSDKIFRLDIVK